MESNMISIDNEVTVLPGETTPIATSVCHNTAISSDKIAENTFKIATDMLKEGVATAKDNRVIYKKFVDSEIEAVHTDIEVQKAEYNRVTRKLEGDLPPKERTHYENRAEILSDRIHATEQTNREDMRQNMPPKQKGMPIWGWISLIVAGLGGGFAFGRYYQSRH